MEINIWQEESQRKRMTCGTLSGVHTEYIEINRLFSILFRYNFNFFASFKTFSEYYLYINGLCDAVRIIYTIRSMVYNNDVRN